MNDAWTLIHGKDYIPDGQFEAIRDAVKEHYRLSSPDFWMWKMFQFGFTYGVRAERDRRKKKGRK